MAEQEFRSYRVLAGEISGEYEEKKSRFLAHLAPCDNEEEALSYIETIKKRYYDARHNCTAMVIGPNSGLTRCSDDGEPSGTAGKPMLEVLLGAELTNVACVVTRYFGGTLLGTGGLVRAYTSAVQSALSGAEIRTVCYCAELFVTVDYRLVTPLKHFFERKVLTVFSEEYLEKARFLLRVRAELLPEIKAALIELTGGSAVLEEGKKSYEAI